jgi:hypothetical protein
MMHIGKKLENEKTKTISSIYSFFGKLIKVISFIFSQCQNKFLYFLTMVHPFCSTYIITHQSKSTVKIHTK